MKILPEESISEQKPYRELKIGEHSDSESLSSEKSTEATTHSTPSDHRHSHEDLSGNIRLLKLAYDFVFDQLEIPDDQKSEAQKQDEIRYLSLKEKINAVVTQYDERIARQGSDYEKFLNLESCLIKGTKELNSDTIRSFMETLPKDVEPIVESNGLIDNLSNRALKARREMVSFAAGFFLKQKDIAIFEKLPKEKREKIKLIQECIALENDPNITEEQKSKRYTEINASFEDLTDKEKRRERRNIWNILAKQSHRDQLFSGETVQQVASAITHPISKVAKDDTLSLGEKTTKISTKIAKKTFKAGKYLVGKAVDSAQFLVKHSVKQPLMATYRLPTAMISGIEFLTLQTQAFAEEDPIKKERLQKEVEAKRKDLSYESEKFIRAVAASAGIALMDTAVISSAGVAVPAMSAVHGAKEAILIAAEVVDKVQNVRDTAEFIGERVEVISKHKEQFKKNTQQRRSALSSQKSLHIKTKIQGISIDDTAVIERETLQMSAEDRRSISVTDVQSQHLITRKDLSSDKSADSKTSSESSTVKVDRFSSIRTSFSLRSSTSTNSGYFAKSKKSSRKVSPIDH